MKRHIFKNCICFCSICLVFAASICNAEAPEVNDDPDQFSFVWISDTQTLTEKPSLAEKIPDIFKWILRTKKDYNTLAVLHTGDVVENGWNDRYWHAINAGIDLLTDDLPFIASAGNHDVAKSHISYEPWMNQNFVLKQDPDYQYRGGEGYYSLFYPGDEKIIVAAIGYNSINDDGVAWLTDVFNQYPDHTGVLIVHSFLSYINGEDSIFTKPGKFLFDRVVIPCSNLKLVLSGHIKGSDAYSVHLTDSNGMQRTVNMLRYDYQYAAYPNLIGYIRVLRFDPKNRSIEIMTYSPIQDNMHYKFAKENEEHFILEDAF